MPRKRASDAVIEETAATSRPRRAVKEVVKDTEENVQKPAKKRNPTPKAAKETKVASTTKSSKAAASKAKAEKPAKRKAESDSIEQPATATNARKRTKTATSNSKKEAPKSSTVNGTKAKEVDTHKERDSKSYWLMKAEPESRLEKGVDVKFSIDDLREAKEPEAWDGVRNAAARNHMRAMKEGDLAFFYHSNCKVPGIVGTMEIVKEHSVDDSAFDPAHPYYDEKSDRKNPKWDVVHVEFRSKFDKIISLTELKSLAKDGGALQNLQMIKQSRLSVSPVTPDQWEFIMGLTSTGEANAAEHGSKPNDTTTDATEEKKAEERDAAADAGDSI